MFIHPLIEVFFLLRIERNKNDPEDSIKTVTRMRYVFMVPRFYALWPSEDEILNLIVCGDFRDLGQTSKCHLSLHINACSDENCLSASSAVGSASHF